MCYILSRLLYLHLCLSGKINGHIGSNLHVPCCILSWLYRPAIHKWVDKPNISSYPEEKHWIEQGEGFIPKSSRLDLKSFILLFFFRVPCSCQYLLTQNSLQLGGSWAIKSSYFTGNSLDKYVTQVTQKLWKSLTQVLWRSCLLQWLWDKMHFIYEGLVWSAGLKLE